MKGFIVKFSNSLTVGLAIFAMLFGAGNVVFPLGLGRTVGDQVLYALLGLCISAILIPVIGLVASMLFDGNYKKFMGTMGALPAAVITFICMILIGPFGAIPRCLTLAHAVVRWYVPGCTAFWFSFLAVVFIFICTMRKSLLVELLGKVFGPIKLVLLFSIIIFGIFSPLKPVDVGFTAFNSFIYGLREGFWMLDLLGTIFFSGLILEAVRRRAKDAQENLGAKDIAMIGLKGGIIGGILLGLVYTGFCFIAAMHGAQLVDVAQDQILSALAISILGSHAGILANITVVIACITTALALTAVFADYIRNGVFNGRISYLYALLITTVCTFVMANLGFAGIMKMISPVVITCYPALVMLSLLNIANKLFGFKYIKIPVFMTLALTIFLNYKDLIVSLFLNVR